jgi:SAM-dependent methyltransferase
MSLPSENGVKPAAEESRDPVDGHRTVPTGEHPADAVSERLPEPAGVGGDPAEPDTTSTTFDDWLKTPLGDYVAKREHAIFNRVLPDLFGYYAMQMGAAQLAFLGASRIGNRFTVGWNTTADFFAEADQLPFAENQFDVIVMPHVLEFHALPHEALREVFRVLRPEGRLLLTGFNPFSLYGSKRFFGRERSGVWGGNFIALSRVKDWLTVLGFDVLDGQLDCYNIPASSERNLQRLEGFARAGERWWPFAGGIYYLHAVKRVAGVRLIKPDWARAPRRRAAAAARSRGSATALPVSGANPTQTTTHATKKMVHEK